MGLEGKVNSGGTWGKSEGRSPKSERRPQSDRMRRHVPRGEIGTSDRIVDEFNVTILATTVRSYALNKKRQKKHKKDRRTKSVPPSMARFVRSQSRNTWDKKKDRCNGTNA